MTPVDLAKENFLKILKRKTIKVCLTKLSAKTSITIIDRLQILQKFWHLDAVVVFSNKKLVFHNYLNQSFWRYRIAYSTYEEFIADIESFQKKDRIFLKFYLEGLEIYCIPNIYVRPWSSNDKHYIQKLFQKAIAGHISKSV